jgi:cold shock CspA family protein/ribosome-associated translation inhibitor RaiA
VQTPIEITLRDVPSSPTLQNLLRQQAKRLDRFCENLTSCRVAIERPHRHQQAGNPYRVRIEVTLPPRKDLVVVQDPEDNQKHTGLHAVIRRAFRTMERQLKDSTDVRRGDVKTHAEPRALVVRLFDDYGFLKSLDGREIYFHRNTVLHGDFDNLEVGSEVRFEESVGEEGPQATTVQLVNRVGAQTSSKGSERLPPGWK